MSHGTQIGKWIRIFVKVRNPESILIRTEIIHHSNDTALHFDESDKLYFGLTYYIVKIEYLWIRILCKSNGSLQSAMQIARTQKYWAYCPSREIQDILETIKAIAGTRFNWQSKIKNILILMILHYDKSRPSKMIRHTVSWHDNNLSISLSVNTRLVIAKQEKKNTCQIVIVWLLLILLLWSIFCLRRFIEYWNHQILANLKIRKSTSEGQFRFVPIYNILRERLSNMMLAWDFCIEYDTRVLRLTRVRAKSHFSISSTRVRIEFNVTAYAVFLTQVCKRSLTSVLSTL